MKCPVCQAWTTIKDTRKSPVWGYIRRRECGNEHRFTTQEKVIPDEIMKEFRSEHARTVRIKGKK
jgi:transcriptional regulator NrdR family protein